MDVTGQPPFFPPLLVVEFAVAVWDIVTRVYLRTLQFCMRPASFVRLGIAVCGALALWLVSASTVEAAPVAKRHQTRVARCLCESRPMPRRLRARPTFERSAHRTAYYILRTERLVVHRNVSSWLERGRRAKPLRDGDAAALQNSAAAVSGEDDQLLLASLEPLGMLAAPQTRITVNGVVTPRSPRGPPSSPA